MGHYHDEREEMYAEQRAESRERRYAALPGIIASLESARVGLSRRAQDIEGSTRIMAELEYALLALRGQEPRPC